MRRRRFVGLTAGMSAAGFAGAWGAKREKLRAAVIGHTGRGDYGHRMDVVFRGLTDVELVAVADADAQGREAARKRTGAPRAYADYTEMLTKEKPDLVSVAPRWTDQHHSMAMAALREGAHLYMEKPFTPTLAEADEILSLAEEKNCKIAVAHQMGADPHILRLKKEIENGLVGDLLEIRVYGKMDARAGGEDMVVLGTHLFDMTRYFAGDALWCTARVLEKGKPARAADARESKKENIGPIVGDAIYAHFSMEGGVNVTYISRGAQRESAGGWGLELVGSTARVRIMANHPPTLYLMESEWREEERVDRWGRWPAVEPYHAPEDGLEGNYAANRRVVKDWLRAIAEDREPICSGYRAMKALEMIHAVWAAGLTGKRTELPLVARGHPLAKVA